MMSDQSTQLTEIMAKVVGIEQDIAKIKEQLFEQKAEKQRQATHRSFSEMTPAQLTSAIKQLQRDVASVKMGHNLKRP